MEVAVLLANPAASQFTGGLHRTVVRALSRRFSVEAVWPSGPNHTREVAARAVAEGAALVVAMGGDGVVHHTVQGLAGSQVPLGIIPAGTTNVVARLVGLPRRPTAALGILTSDFAVVSHPLLGLTGEAETGAFERLAVFSFGAGTDAAVVQRAEADPFRKYRFGGIHYARTAMGTVWSDLRHRRPAAVVETARERALALGAMVQFLDAYTYFGRIPLRFDADLPQPMTVLTIEQIRMRRALGIALGALTRRGLGKVRRFQVWKEVEELTISSKEPLESHADGELLPAATRITVRYRPDLLAIAVPPATRHPDRG